MIERSRAEAAQSSRRTLDDIRREIDAEFAALEGEVRADDDDTRALEALRVPQRRPRQRSYLKIAVFCTIVVEVFILGYVAGRYYGDERLESALSTLMAGRTASVPPAASVRSAQLPTTATAETPSPVATLEPQSSDRDVPTTAAVESAIPVPDSERAAASPVAPPVPMTTMAVPLAPTAPAEPKLLTPKTKLETPETKRPIPDARRVTPEGRLVTRLPQSVTPEVKAVTPDAKLVMLALPGPGDWVESQSQLRTALREWLRLSGYAGPNSESDDAEVVLNADGQTAKTRVPVRVGNHIIIREQRWRRDARGWSVVEEHQVQSPRPR